MNKGTIIRTVARFAVSAYTAFCVWQTVVDGFGNKTASLVWAILIILFGWLVDFATTWYNNDFTPIAAEKTGEMRFEKARLKGEVQEPDIVIEDYISDEDDYLEDGDDHIEGDENE